MLSQTIALINQDDAPVIVEVGTAPLFGPVNGVFAIE
jgi:hypothetical protein